MPYVNGQIITTIIGERDNTFIPLDTGWLTAVTLSNASAALSLTGPDYAQLFITFGQPTISNRAIVLAQGIINWNDSVYWTGKQLVEEGMHLAFVIRAFGSGSYNYAYFIEKICPANHNNTSPRTDLC